MNSREQVFETLLASLGAADPLGSVIAQAARICRGSALVVNELGETLRAVGAAPGHLVSEWVLAHVFAGPSAAASQRGSAREYEVRQGQIGRWSVSARVVRIRQRVHTIVIAVHEDSGADGRAGGEIRSAGEDVSLVLDTAVKILRAFEGFESFSMSTRREESARLMRELEAGVAPGREPAKWRTLENFGFEAYAPVRVVRARSAAASDGSARKPTAAVSEPGSASSRRTEFAAGGQPLTAMKGIVLSDSGVHSSLDEMTALCAEDFAIEGFLTDGMIGAGVSEAFTALSQVPEMLRSADVALAAAEPGAIVHVEQMRPVEWAAARMSSRFDQKIARRFLERLAQGTDSWLTLTTYLDCAGSIAEAARALNVHENTVRYRLGQIENALGARLTDPRAVADVVVAFECRRMGNGA
ncbi:PucR family transcriptional regulator [Brevibacterium renqingii]|uniref:PucR family transcriptional regulator n=1 Tax=Brevibacterium renqingii TaxID=2776916 RepID=UPI001ADF1D1D|nr:PucR family transcriptional regulator [Brevibacterium renqingii]